MAHLARLGALTDELVTLLTGTSTKTERAKFNTHRESALRALRYSNYSRTNQFDVTARLEGLEEKFRIYNEDPLADALGERVEKVSKLQTKWAPEILHLFLELSDRPLVNSKAEELDFLKETETDTGPPLRWKDLVAEDPLLRDKHVWRNVDFGAESSDEDDYDETQSELSETTETTTQLSLEENSGRRPEDNLIDFSNPKALSELREAQFWLKDPKVGEEKLYTVKKSITELQVIREILFMLSGYPTSLFEVKGPEETNITPSKSYFLKHASAEAFYGQLQCLADYGSALKYLETWANRPQTIPLLQAFQNSITHRSSDFKGHMSKIQSRYIHPETDIVVSLLQVQDELELELRLLSKLSTITRLVDAEPYAHAFRYLEILYDETCTSQMADDEQAYELIGTIFFECFQVYLRPIRLWMEEGELGTTDKIFFLSRSSGDLDRASIWQSRFKLRQTQNGILHAPSFLRTAAGKIFTTGKSVVVLKQLNKFQSMRSSESSYEPVLQFSTVCETGPLQLAPFSELFDVAFSLWIQSKHHAASTTLRKILFDSYGLRTSLEALSNVYFMADGAHGASFTNPLFDKLDTLDTSWSDRFTLTELLQSSFGVLPSVNKDRLSTTVLPLGLKNQDISQYRRTVKVLSIIRLNYHLSWPIQIILTVDTLSSYQRIFTFLFQIRRSAHILARQRLLVDRLYSTSRSNERSLYYSLRTQLQWFVQSLYYYLTFLVIEPASSKMRQAIEDAIDIDTMIEVHSTYIKSTCEKALLGIKLELIHKTILKILDLAIRLEDSQAANTLASKEARDQQQEQMDLSMASLGLPTPRKAETTKPQARPYTKTPRRSFDDSSNSEQDSEVDVDLSILSTSMLEHARQDLSYLEDLRSMEADFNRLVRFVATGLRGVGRAGAVEEARSWDVLGEILESGLGQVGGISY
ncbi:Spc98 family-domain-containing protein [Amylocarpus encephaloides]|uniref:Spindle pole body component n=1 Tax=Amylocarpus encephaloides TaxID=45428 RepID=A0A9P7YK53_9HELO|nr:Spc98 family-domain-containing protein [Amylocarpus encephaloides]